MEVRNTTFISNNYDGAEGPCEKSQLFKTLIAFVLVVVVLA